MSERVSKIFEERPKQWGFRGDPYLWDELEKHFQIITTPCSQEEFCKEFYSAFEKHTGLDINTEESIYVPKFAHGGMSSGMISRDFWVTTLIPLLIERLNRLNK